MKLLQRRLRLVSATLMLLGATVAQAADNGAVDIAAGNTREVHVGVPVASVTVSRNIVDVEVIAPDELDITAKRAGRTEVTAVDKSGRSHLYVVRVSGPGDNLRDRLRALFPGQKIEAQTSAGAVVLSGSVNDFAVADAVAKAAVALAGAGGQPQQLINLLQVIGAPQVQLHVRFAEVSRTALREIGFNAWGHGSTGSGANQRDYIGGVTSPATALGPNLAPQLSSTATGAGTTGTALAATALQSATGLPVLAGPMSSAFNFVFSSGLGFPLTATLSLLSSRGFAKTLAEPTMVALSGQEASFLAGGEFPVPLTQALGQLMVDYKKFGVQLRFTPFVLADETIQLKLATTVSDIDPTIGVIANQITIPGLTTREAATTVRLRSGQSFAIGGLISDKMRSTVNKIPLLGDIPVLGALFRSNSFQRDETELLVVITVELASPRGKNEHIAVPGEDELSDPSDLKLFLLGMSEAHVKAPPPAGGVGFVR
jgi:pilus assembly protein CpaC